MSYKCILSPELLCKFHTIFQKNFFYWLSWVCNHQWLTVTGMTVALRLIFARQCSCDVWQAIGLTCVVCWEIWSCESRLWFDLAHRPQKLLDTSITYMYVKRSSIISHTPKPIGRGGGGGGAVHVVVPFGFTTVYCILFYCNVTLTQFSVLTCVLLTGPYVAKDLMDCYQIWYKWSQWYICAFIYF